MERLGEFAGVPEERVDPRKGVTKYPFGELEVGHALRVRGRERSTVRSAVKRWVGLDRARRGLRFLVWRATVDGVRCVIVKRTK